MPRLTDYSYLQTYKELRAAWLSDPVSFALLTPNEQWDLFGYFCIEHELSDARLLAYRREVSKIDASLPQRAGRAAQVWRKKLPRLEAYRQRPRRGQRTKQRSKRYIVTIFSAVHPEIDPQRLTRALRAAFADHEAVVKTKRGKRLR